MAGIIGGLIGVFIEIVTPWSDFVIQFTSSTLSDPLVASNVVLSSLLHLVVWITAYLSLPIFGAVGGIIYR
jgi:hypothetical protein